MILPDHTIHDYCSNPLFAGPPLVEPYVAANVQPASIDVRLSNEFRVFERDQHEFIDMADPVDITKLVTIADEDYFTLHPGEFVLGVTIEKVNMPDDLVARIEGKSSLGRLGLIVHATAGYIDPGFSGPITLEMTCLHPLAIRLRPGMLIGQISFHQMLSRAHRPYQGRYQGARGVEPSKYGKSIDDVTAERLADSIRDTSLDVPEPELTGGFIHCDCVCHQPIGSDYHETGVESCVHCEIIGG